MSWLPVSTDMMFKDFEDSLIECEIVRNGETISRVKGMLEQDEGYILFKYGEDIQAGDVVYSENGNDIVRKVVIGNYNGNPDGIEAYI